MPKLPFKFKFTAQIGERVFHPKGFYYQKKHVILVGCTEKDHTIREKHLIDDVIITVETIEQEDESEIRFIETGRDDGYRKFTYNQAIERIKKLIDSDKEILSKSKDLSDEDIIDVGCNLFDFIPIEDFNEEDYE